MFQIRPARFMDAVRLAPELRVEDVQEIRLVWSVEALEGLFYSLINSDRACALYGRGRPVALWGVSNATLSGLGLGVPWMLASRALFEQRRDLVSQSRIWVDRLLLDYDVLANVTDCSNTAHLRWLDWCGFRPLRVHAQFGPFGRPFQEFYRINERRHADADALRAVLRQRPPPRPLELPTGLQRLVTELADALSAGVAEAPACLAGLDAAELARWPRRWRSNLVALLLEAAQRVMTRDGSGSPPGDGDQWQLAAALTDTAEVARFAGGDAPELLAEMSVCVARAPGAALDVTEQAAPPSPITRALHGHLQALTLGGRVAPVQGMRLWEAALRVNGAERPLGLSRAALHRVLREHHLAARWRTRTPGQTLSRGPVLERLHGAWVAWPALRRALQDVLAEHPPSLPQAPAVNDLTTVAGAVADRVSRRLFSLPRLGAVSTGYAERHGLYRLLRVHLLATMGVARQTLVPVLVDELSGLLAVADFEDMLLTLPEPSSTADRIQALGAAVRRMWDVPDDGSRPGGVLALVLPALACPGLATAQLPGALLAWHLAQTAAAEDVLQRVSVSLAQQQQERRRRVARCLRDAARGLDMVTVQRHLDGHVRRSAPADPGSEAVADAR